MTLFHNEGEERFLDSVTLAEDARIIIEHEFGVRPDTPYTPRHHPILDDIAQIETRVGPGSSKNYLKN